MQDLFGQTPAAAVKRQDLLEPVKRRPRMQRSHFHRGSKPACATPLPEPGHDCPSNISSAVKRPFSYAHSLASGLQKAGEVVGVRGVRKPVPTEPWAKVPCHRHISLFRPLALFLRRWFASEGSIFCAHRCTRYGCSCEQSNAIRKPDPSSRGKTFFANRSSGDFRRGGPSLRS